MTYFHIYTRYHQKCVIRTTPIILLRLSEKKYFHDRLESVKSNKNNIWSVIKHLHKKQTRYYFRHVKDS